MFRPRRLAFVLTALALAGGEPLLAKGKGFNIPSKVSSVVVTRYKKLSDARDTPDKGGIAVIKNKETISRLISLVNGLPPSGSMMIKMGDVEYIHVEFNWHYDKPPVEVKIFDGMVRAPDTSFYERLPAEKEIYDILKSAKAIPQKGLRVKSPVAVRVEEFHHASYQVSQLPPNRTVEIKDKKTVEQLAEWVNQLPLKGELFASFTPRVAVTDAFFIDKDGLETAVIFYGESVSTTDGSFYAGNKEGEKLQNDIWQVLQSALATVAPERISSFDIKAPHSVFIQLRKNLTPGPLRGPWANVGDQKVLSRCAELLSKLPTTGDIMKKWGENTEVLTAVFSQPGAPKMVIEFYAGRIMTPSGTFYPAGKNPEAPLYKLLKEQLKEGK